MDKCVSVDKDVFIHWNGTAYGKVRWRANENDERKKGEEFIDPTRQYPDPDCLLDWWCRHRIHLSFRPSRMALTSRLQRSQFMRFYLCIRNIFFSPFSLRSPFYRSILFTVCIRRISIIQVNSIPISISHDFYRIPQTSEDGVAKIHNKYISSEMNLSNGLALPESKYAGGWSSFFISIFVRSKAPRGCSQLHS